MVRQKIFSKQFVVFPGTTDVTGFRKNEILKLHPRDTENILSLTQIDRDKVKTIVLNVKIPYTTLYNRDGQ